MWITGDVDLPDEILDAHERGELVFFVGAGASVGEPSNLPLFDGLARQLAELASHEFSPGGGLDFFIGQLESLPQGFDAHQHTLRLISDPKSRFNPLHSVVVELAGIGGAFRVVTTNYDNHLASAAASGAIAIPDTWYAPALPLGHDFAGLVHLHGSVLRPKEELILTDRDFGHAYITDAWATRFLLPMFDRFTVVFVGYSHDDVIMRYLALGLPSRGKEKTFQRFAFTDDPKHEKWGYLGIQPIAYPVVEGDHEALVAALTAWADRAKMGQTDHQSRVQEITGGGTVMPLPDHDYLHDRLRTTEGARAFAQAAEPLPDEDKLRWLTWLEELPEFRSLFSQKDVPEPMEVLGEWFAKTFIESPRLNGAALQTLQRLGQEMATSLYWNASWGASQLSRQDAAAGQGWTALLTTSIHGQSAPPRMRLLPEQTSYGMAALRVTLRPFLKLKRRWFVDESTERTDHPDAEVVWNSHADILTQHIQSVVETSAPADRPLGGVLEEAIAAAYDLLEAYHGERGWDPLSWRRSAIEPHAQDKLREPLDAVIDGLRDYGVKALPQWPDLPDRWWNSGRVLMRRLALHLVANDPDRSADDKLLWLLDRTGLYAHGLKHETYQVLAAAVGGATPLLRQRVLDAVADVPHYPEGTLDRDSAYVRYNLLAWLTQADPDWAEAQTVFDAIQAENPDFGVREHPDLDMWVTSGFCGGKLPMEVEDFVQMLAQSASSALDDLLSQDYSDLGFEQPGWRDALELVRQAVEQHSDLGVKLWDTVGGRDDLNDKQIDLWRAITRGWGKGQLGGSGADAVQRVATLVVDKDSSHDIGQFLLEQIQQQINSDESPVLVSMRELARSLWREQGPGFTRQEDLPPLSSTPLYLNSWPGFLTQYWASEVDRRWRHSREDWNGLSDEESEALIALLNGNEDALDATQPGIAGGLFFYFAADADFTVKHVLPLFRDPQRHAFAWYPFLYHPRYNDRLLSAGLLDSMGDELGRLDDLPDRSLQHRFLGLVASVLSYAGIPDADRKRLLDQTVIAAQGSHAEGFAAAVVRLLNEDDVNGAEVWRRWLKDHLERRLKGVPRIASAGELAVWADVVPLVVEFVPAAASLFKGSGIGFGKWPPQWELPERAFAEHGHELVAFFTERIQNTSALEFMWNERVQQLVQEARDELGDSVVRPLVEAAQRGGFLETTV